MAMLQVHYISFTNNVIYITVKIRFLVLYISQNVVVLRYTYQIFDPLLCLPLLYQYPTNIASSFDTCQYLANCMMVKNCFKDTDSFHFKKTIP